MWDPEKLSELYRQKESVVGEFVALKEQLHNEHASDKWTKEKNEAYARGQVRHGQLKRELDVLNDEIAFMESKAPKAVKEMKSSALYRYIASGGKTDDLDESERAQFLEKRYEDEADGFHIRAVVRTDTTSGAGSVAAGVDSDVSTRLFQSLEYFGDVTAATSSF